MRQLRALKSTHDLARPVCERASFFVRQAVHARSPARYRLRETGVTVFLRHATPDVNAFDQIFRLGHYEAPAEVESALGPGPLRIVDLGANVGFFGAYVLGRRPDASLIAYEPAPENVGVLEQTVAANGNLDWQVVAACAANRDGSVHFADGLFTNSHVAQAGTGRITVPAVDVFPHLSDADLLKIDIEGSEWAILEDERFRTVPARAVALEYHPEQCPSPDPRTYAGELLAGAGFTTRDAEFAATADHGMIWAWKSR